MAPLRCFSVLAPAALLLVAGTLSTAMAATTHDEPAVYLVRHTVSSGAIESAPVSLIGYTRAVLRGARHDAGQLQLVPLWAELRDGEGSTRYLLDLDPGSADDAATLGVLAEGFTATITPDGAPAALRAVNQTAWRALEKRDASAARQLLVLHHAPGLRPVALPASVAVGDHVAGWQRIEPFGSIGTTLQVLQVTPSAVLMDLLVEDDQATGEGRLVVQRSDGMPIELRMEVRLKAERGMPAAVHAVHLADMRHDPMLGMADDLANRSAYVEQIEQRLGRPPFSRPTQEPSAYTHRPAEAGALEPYMVAAGALPALEPFMGALWVPAQSGPGQWLALGARAVPALDLPATPMAHETVLMSRLHRVEVLDAQGLPVRGLEPRTVTPTLYFAGRYSVMQNEPGFPFHLPLGAPRELLERIRAVRMTVDAEVYAFDSTETLTPGTRSTRNPEATLQWPAAYRATLLQGRQSWREKTGLYSVVVALDAEGNLLPSEQLIVAPLAAAHPARLAELPLAWENSLIPIRTEIATPRPIAEVQVRHYRWQSVPKRWTFPMYP